MAKKRPDLVPQDVSPATTFTVDIPSDVKRLKISIVPVPGRTGIEVYLKAEKEVSSG